MAPDGQCRRRRRLREQPGASGRRRLVRRNRKGVALRPFIIISGGGSAVRRIFDREIRLFYQPADDRRRLMQLCRRRCRQNRLEVDDDRFSASD